MQRKPKEGVPAVRYAQPVEIAVPVNTVWVEGHVVFAHGEAIVARFLDPLARLHRLQKLWHQGNARPSPKKEPGAADPRALMVIAGSTEAKNNKSSKKDSTYNIVEAF